ncbi:hypothetical protein BGZ95_008796, partial [Linnemannia exigua]
MDTDGEHVSQELTTQEFEFGIENGAVPEKTNYITVTANRSRAQFLVRFPVAYFGDKSTNTNYMIEWVKHVLAEVVAI